MMKVPEKRFVVMYINRDGDHGYQIRYMFILGANMPHVWL